MKDVFGGFVTVFTIAAVRLRAILFEEVVDKTVEVIVTDEERAGGLESCTAR